MPDPADTETLAEDEREALTAAFAASTRNPDHLAFLVAPAVERILAARIVQARAGEGALRERVEALADALEYEAAHCQGGETRFVVGLIVPRLRALTTADPS